MRFKASILLLAAITLMPAAASAKECVEPYGKLVEVSQSVFEVRIKPECEGRSEAAATAKAATKSSQQKPKRKTLTAAPRKGSMRGKVIARREETGCEKGIGAVINTTSAEIVIGFRAECKHLAALMTPRRVAASFLSDALYDGGFEEEITPKRSYRQRKGMKCDEAGTCTAVTNPKERVVVRKRTGNQIVVAEASL